MILIASASYIHHCLASEFGYIPPSMLPVQNKRLYEHQYKLVQSLNDRLDYKENIFISLPSDYEIPLADQQLLSKLNISVIKEDSNLSLSSSICQSIERSKDSSNNIRILFGDTLFSSLPVELDSYLYGTPEDSYKWDYDNLKDAYSGYFSFSSKDKLKRSLETFHSFTEAVESCDLNRISSDGWLDFGLQNTYYRSISKFTTQRSFNSLDISKFSVVKRSNDSNKMKAESTWLNNVPVDMKHYVPTVYSTFDGGYELEYLYLSSLASIYAYGKLPTSIWTRILNSCIDYLSDEFSHKPPCDSFPDIAHKNNELFTSKTLERLKKYNIDLHRKFKLNGNDTPTLNEIIAELDSFIEKDSIDHVSLMHGDFCFSNTLYDFKSSSVKVIDPRGISGDGKVLSSYGDIRYDVAKLAHSIIGKYDLIIAGRFEYFEDSRYDISFRILDETDKQIDHYFLRKVEDTLGISDKVTYAIMINLFLSMIPLHSDNPMRQKAFLANALRLYMEFKSL